MKTHTSVWKFGCGLLLCLLGLQGARAQKQDVELDATAIDFHSLFVGKNELFPDNVHPSDYIGTYTNEAGCRDQLVMKLTLAEEKPSEKAQKALPKVYDEDINPLKQIDNGKVMHIQDSSFLEEGQGYNQEKVLRFFKGWTPKSIETQQ